MKWIKKGFHKFFIDEKGAVSIYAIVITLLLFIFNGVLIDFIRIMAAERETDQAMKAAMRSTMSSYHQGVKGYGLFGFDGEASEIFEKVLKENLKQEEGDYFRFIDTKLEDEVNLIIKDERMLSNKTTFEYQVLEEMKYIAPMEIGKTIIEGFLQVSRGMQEASAYVDISTSIQDDVFDREQLLEKIKTRLEITIERSEELGELVQAPSKDSTKFPTVHNLNDLLKHLNKYKEIKEREDLPPLDEDATDEEKEEREQEEEQRKEDDKNIKTFERQAKELVEEFMELKSNAMREELEDILGFIDEAEALNNKIKKTIEEKRNEVKEKYNNANQASDMKQNDNGNADGTISNIEEAKKKLDDYIIDPQFFIDLKAKSEIARQEVAENNSTNLAGYISQLKSVVIDGSFQGQLHVIQSHSGKIKELQVQAEEAVKEAYRKMTEEPPIAEEDKEKTKEKEKEAEDELGNANEELEKALEEAENILGDQELINIIADLARKYEGSIESSKNEFNRDNPDDLAKDAMSFVDVVFGALGDILINSRDKAYINEYILTKFKAHDFSKKGSAGFALENNQVEYIMYGLGTTGANYTAALTEIFAFRFAVNFLEAFTEPAVRAFGPWMWAAALVHAAKETVQDMQRISKGKTVEFFKGMYFQTDYYDYLRLFLFIHPEGNKIARTMALIENDSGADLTTLPTYVSAEASTSVKLWFLPGVTKMLGRTGIISGRVENNRYFIDKKIDYSY